MTRSTKYQLIETRLGTDLERWVRERAADGTGCRPIARELSERTGVAISYDSLRVWFPAVFGVPARRRRQEVSA